MWRTGMNRLRQLSPNLILFLIGTAFMGLSGGIVETTFNNYLSKIALQPDHVSPTLALGVTINHIVSMTIPTLGGWLWIRYGHPSVFLAAAGIAVLMLVFSSRVSVAPAR